MKIKRFEFNMFPVNCYVLWDDTKEAVVIDPGCFYEEEKQALKKFILTNELNVKHLLNTHLHLDHIFGNPFMLKEFGLSAEANKADEYWIDEAPKQSRMFGFQLQEDFSTSSIFLPENSALYTHYLVFFFLCGFVNLFDFLREAFVDFFQEVRQVVFGYRAVFFEFFKLFVDVATMIS